MTPAAYYALCQAEREEVLDQMMPRQMIEFTEQFEDCPSPIRHSRAWRPLMTRLRELASGLLDRVEGPVPCADPHNSSCDCTLCEKIRVEDAVIERAHHLSWAAYPLD